MNYAGDGNFKKVNFSKIKTVVFAALFIYVVFGVAARAQNNLPTAQTQTNTATSTAPAIASASPVVSSTAIPVSDVIAQIENASSTLKEIAASASANQTAETVERELPALTEEINAKLDETARIVEERASLEKLRAFESEWRTLTRNLIVWQNDLTERARKLEGDLRRLGELGERWQKTFATLQTVETPPEVAARVEEIVQTIAQTRRQIEIQQTRVVSLQNRVAEQQKRVDEANNSIRQTRDALVGQLFVQDSPPIWSRELWAQAGQEDFFQAAGRSVATQMTALNEFAGRNAGRIFIHVLIFALFVTALVALRRRAQPWVETESNLRRAAVIFYLPVSTALVLAIFFSSWIYPQTPQILRAFLGAIALVPAVVILRRLVERPVYPVLYLLVIFYFADQLRTIFDSLPLFTRLLFLSEMLGGFFFFLWLRRAGALRNVSQKTRHKLIFRTFQIAALLALPVFAVAFLADVLGYVSLARLVGNAILRSAYAALVFYAVVQIVDGLIVFALRFRPLNLLKMVRDYRPLIQRRLRKYLRWLAIGLWALIALELLTLREFVLQSVKAFLTAELSWGSLNISLGNVLLFALTVWAAFALARFVRFALEEDVYPRIELERGLPYAISTVLNYTILLIGFFLAVAAAGFDLTRFTILVGAFGVGIGFGLQNIINNFVSGLILLFERPVKVGDVIQIADATGTVQSIGIRASIVRVWDNSEIIVPNSKLIADSVTNWTFSSRQRGIEIPISAARAAEPQRVLELLREIAAAHPLVADAPAPQTLFDETTADALKFRLRAWTNDFSQALKIRSDLVAAINEKFAENNILISSPAPPPILPPPPLPPELPPRD